MSSLTEISGKLDAIITMTGHKDLKLTDHYSTCNEDDQKQFSQKIMSHIRQERAKDSQEVNSFENVVSLLNFKSGTDS